MNHDIEKKFIVGGEKYVRKRKLMLGILFAIVALGLLSAHIFWSVIFGLAAISIFFRNREQKQIENHRSSDRKVDNRPNRPGPVISSGILNYNKIYSIDRLPDRFSIIDIETTGLNHLRDEIVEVALLQVKDGEIVDRYSQLINPLIPIPPDAARINGITDSMVKNQPMLSEVIGEIYNRLSSEPVIVGYNVEFDLKFISRALAKNGLVISNISYFDVLDLVRQTLPKDLPNRKLETVKKYLGIEQASHRAISDCYTTLEVLRQCLSIKERKQRRVRFDQERAIFHFNDSEKLFIETLKNRLCEAGINGELGFRVLSDKTIAFTMNGKQIGRVKLSGRKYKMQILDENHAVWLDIDDVSEAIGNMKHWLNYAEKLSS